MTDDNGCRLFRGQTVLVSGPSNKRGHLVVRSGSSNDPLHLHVPYQYLDLPTRPPLSNMNFNMQFGLNNAGMLGNMQMQSIDQIPQSQFINMNNMNTQQHLQMQDPYGHHQVAHMSVSHPGGYTMGHSENVAADEQHTIYSSRAQTMRHHPASVQL